MKKQEEHLFMLRLWQDEENWHASLKQLGTQTNSVRYFHSIQSLNSFLSNSTEEKEAGIELNKF